MTVTRERKMIYFEVKTKNDESTKTRLENFDRFMNNSALGIVRIKCC